MPNLDFFFNLGNKATRGDPLRKAKYDYCLYWIVFLAFCSISINYFYNFFFKSYPISTLLWGVVVGIFCWFNYWGLLGFRTIYINMKDAQRKISLGKSIESKEDSVDDMVKGFKDLEDLKGGRDANERIL